jgi:hypothetical protein
MLGAIEFFGERFVNYSTDRLTLFGGGNLELSKKWFRNFECCFQKDHKDINMGKFNLKASKEPGFPEAVIPSTEGISSSSSDDNMIQERDIHCRCCLAELPGKLDIRSARRWIAAGVVVWVITY